MISVIIPTYNSAAQLPRLLDSIYSARQWGEIEVIVVDDCSNDRTDDLVGKYPCRYIRLEQNQGPAYCRNIGARHARGHILAFTDSDCCVSGSWFKEIQKSFGAGDTEAVMGRLILDESDYLGDSISALGFPAGGSIGFNKIWSVDPKGYTNSLSSCNCAIKKDIFFDVGGFDESFPYPGGEDSYLAYQLGQANLRIKYCPGMVVYHEARNSMGDFVRWQFKRGMSSWIFSRKVTKRKNYLRLRIWSTGNILKTFLSDRKFPLIVCLLAVSIAIQFGGFFYAKHFKEFS